MPWAILILALLGADRIEPAEFQKLHQELQAPADEPWRSILWKISLLDARKEAAQRQRPIFIWAMDGHGIWLWNLPDRTQNDRIRSSTSGET